MNVINESQLTKCEEVIVEAIPLRDQVADIIRKMILRGEIKGGQLLNERQISQQLNVSTTPIKEALRTLQTEGLINTVPRKGSIVAQLPVENALHTIYMRSALEGVAANFAAQNATEENIEKMRACLCRNDELLGVKGAANQIAKNNAEFHTILRSLSKSEYLIKLIQNLSSIDYTVRMASLSIEIGEPLRAQKEHLAILEAVEQHNSDQAERLLVDHIRRVGIFLIENLDKI